MGFFVLFFFRFVRLFLLIFLKVLWLHLLVRACSTPIVRSTMSHWSEKKACFFKIYFWLRWVFVAARSLSICCERGLLFVVVRGFLFAVASLVAEHGL